MQGFQPQNRHVQHLADGGVVRTVKRMFGMDAEQNARVKEYRENAAREKAAAAAAAPASTPAQPQKAITDYSSGGAMQRREKEQGLANGGMVRGPGTGTSDSIKTELPSGAYVMPADSTAAIGPENLQQMAGKPRGFSPGGKKNPVALSNGENVLQPEQVHAIGVQALDQMKGATHTPAAGLGFSPEQPQVREGRTFLAVGGVNDPEEAERLRRQTAMYVQGAQAAATARPPEIPAASPVAAPPQQGEYGRQMSALGGALADGAAWLGKTVVSAPGYGFSSAPAQPMNQTAATAIAPRATTVPTPGTAANPTDIRLANGAQVTQPEPQPMGDRVATQAQSMAQSPQATQIAPGVFRNGNSYGDSPAAAAGFAPAGAQPTQQNMQAAENLAATSARGFSPASAPAPAGVAAPVVRNSTNDWQARKDLQNLATSAASITNNGGRFDDTKGNNAAQDLFKTGLATDAAARGAQATGDVAAMQANAGLQREQVQQAGGIQREQIQQTGASGRAAAGFNVDRERLGIDRSRVASENTARDVTTQGAQQLQQLRNVLLDPKATPEQRKQAEASLRAVSGKAEEQNRYTVVPGGQEVSPQGVAFTRPSQVIDNRTGQFVQQGAAQPAQQAAPVTGQVYTDAKGNRAKWDGTKYVPA